MSQREELLRLLVCPVCRDGELLGLRASLESGVVRCSLCAAEYPVRDGIPMLLPPGFDPACAHDEIDHAHKHRQASHYDREVAAEFEIMRPFGAPDAYGWLLAEKFRRSVARLPLLVGATVVDGCCGSGMDAQMLAAVGAKVIALDISEGCARRARARAERFGVDYLVVVADVEHLPLRDQGVDIGYVHDGLHHLAHPERGLRELARVTARAVSVNEPADAAGTAIAVRLGLALAEEEAGNRVARLRLADAAREFAERGFDVGGSRYFLYYRHEPGAMLRWASKPKLAPAYRAAVHLANAAFGRWGNKMQLTAVRRS